MKTLFTNPSQYIIEVLELEESLQDCFLPPPPKPRFKNKYAGQKKIYPED